MWISSEPSIRHWNRRKKLTAAYNICEKEVRDLKRKQENLNQYLGRTQTEPVQEHQIKSPAYKNEIGSYFFFSCLPANGIFGFGHYPRLPTVYNYVIAYQLNYQ